MPSIGMRPRVFNVMACHYGDWLAPMVSASKAKIAIKLTRWSLPGLLEQGMPFWPLLQPLGNESAGTGLAMTLGFLIAGRSDALPKASMATFFRARIVASLIVSAALYYVVVVIHYRWFPTRLLGRGPMFYQEGHRFWPSFSAIAHGGTGGEQLMNIFARTWQLAWFMVLLLLFRTARLFAIGLGIPPKYLALVTTLANCLPRRQPYVMGDFGAYVHAHCVSVLCVPQVKVTSRYLVAYTIAPWLVGGHDWKPPLFSPSALHARSCTQRVLRVTVKSLRFCTFRMPLLGTLRASLRVSQTPEHHSSPHLLAVVAR